MDLPIRFKAEADEEHTGLQFTDVLFGFVISELFFRLTRWTASPWYVRAHLIAGAILVLGSYIGYRNSRKRGNYKLRFVNLPLLRFSCDQAMVACYFIFAVASPRLDAANPVFPSAANLARVDANILTWVAALYLVWDLVSLAMSRADNNGKYTAVSFEGRGLVITLLFGLGIVLAWVLWVDPHRLGPGAATGFAFGVAAWLLLYRGAKDFARRETS